MDLAPPVAAMYSGPDCSQELLTCGSCSVGLGCQLGSKHLIKMLDCIVPAYQSDVHAALRAVLAALCPALRAGHGQSVILSFNTCMSPMLKRGGA